MGNFILKPFGSLRAVKKKNKKPLKLRILYHDSVIRVIHAAPERRAVSFSEETV